MIEITISKVVYNIKNSCDVNSKITKAKIYKFKLKTEFADNTILKKLTTKNVLKFRLFLFL